ncbi:hypothetical protein CI238_08129 [Colletotrichum incanum]|uniref:Uncharacterized protein n=1 Tax=Colletotrichum incanum TaxID=1573173 RepID=A0A167EKE7_COLIC|nr:hypothetical protein CI238_08129 [Colletotrichum incanum]
MPDHDYKTTRHLGWTAGNGTTCQPSPSIGIESPQKKHRPSEVLGNDLRILQVVRVNRSLQEHAIWRVADARRLSPRFSLNPEWQRIKRRKKETGSAAGGDGSSDGICGRGDDDAEGVGALLCWKIQDVSGAAAVIISQLPQARRGKARVTRRCPSAPIIPFAHCDPVTTDHPTIDEDCFQQEIGGRVTRMLWLVWACITAAGQSGRITMPERWPRSLAWHGAQPFRSSAFQVVRVLRMDPLPSPSPLAFPLFLRPPKPCFSLLPARSCPGADC